VAIWTQAHYETLRDAIAAGVLTVRYADRTVTYHSLTDMRSLLAEMYRELNPSTAPGYRLASTRKGF
jgi:hypothetical protein